MADLADYAKTLADAVDAALPVWVVGCVDRVYRNCAGQVPPPRVQAAAVRAGRQAQAEVGGAVRALLEADIDSQRATPLTLLRRAVAYPTSVLVAAAVPPVSRDEFAAMTFPDDRYGLTPAAFADIDPSLAEPGLAWGAAKAWVHQQRHGRP
jgi:hypothetical protein